MKPIKYIGYYPFNASKNIMHPSKARPNSIFVFDYVSCDTQDVIRDYFRMGIHNKNRFILFNYKYVLNLKN